MHLADQRLIVLAEKYGTPLYVYDGDLILKRYEELRGFIPSKDLRIHYAMKANYNPAILRLLCEAGAGIDAVSPGDVMLARRVGFPTERILFTANNITLDEMMRVRDLGVLFNIGSLSELERFGEAFPGSEVCLRFNPDVLAGHSAKVQTAGALTKFGILFDDIVSVCHTVAKFRLRVVGLHKHTGSGIKEIDKYLEAMQNLLRVATVENFPDLRFVDFGGGFGVPYRPEEERIDYQTFGRRMAGLFADFCRDYGRELAMYFEPGRYLVAEAGHLIVRVTAIKNNRGRLIAGTNSGFPQLIRPVFYGAYHHLVNLTNPGGSSKIYDVCGNICETGDCFAIDRELAEIREGDLLAIRNAGAYCYAMGGVYNLRPMPGEVLVRGEEDTLVRRPLSDQQLIDQILGECR